MIGEQIETEHEREKKYPTHTGTKKVAEQRFLIHQLGINE